MVRRAGFTDACCVSSQQPATLIKDDRERPRPQAGRLAMVATLAFAFSILMRQDPRASRCYGFRYGVLNSSTPRSTLQAKWPTHSARSLVWHPGASHVEKGTLAGHANFPRDPCISRSKFNLPQARTSCTATKVADYIFFFHLTGSPYRSSRAPNGVSRALSVHGPS